MAKQRGGSRLLMGGVGTLLVVGVIVVIVLFATGVIGEKSESSHVVSSTSKSVQSMSDMPTNIQS